MQTAEKAPAFDKIMKAYLRQVERIEAKEKIGASLGITVIDDGYRISFFHRTYTITSDRIIDANGKTASHHAVSVILCKYLLLCPKLPSDDINPVTYKDFRDAAPYVGGFRNTAEQPILSVSLISTLVRLALSVQ